MCLWRTPTVNIISTGAEDLALCFATRSLDNASVNIIIWVDYYCLDLVDTEKFCFFSILYNFLFWDGRNILVNMTSKWIERSVTPDLHLSSLRYVFGNRPFPVVGLEHNQHKIKAFYPLLDQLVCSASIRLSTAASSMPKKFGSHVWELSICWCMPQQPPRCPKYLGPSTAACTMLFII